MKRILESTLFLLLGVALSIACSDDTTDPVSGSEDRIGPVVTFPETTDRKIIVNEPVTFEATVEEATSCAWYVDDEPVAATPTLTYTFRSAGTYVLRFEAIGKEGRTEYSFVVRAADPLRVSFAPAADTQITCNQGEPIAVAATVTSGDNGVQHKWSVGDKVVGTEAELQYAFPDPGTFTLRYEATNADALTAEAQWPVTVIEVEQPLTIEFTPAPKTTIRCETGASVTIETDVKHGEKGLVHAWTVDGVKVSDAATFRHAFTAPGTYAVAYEGKNAKQEGVTAAWTVEATHLFADFEALAALPADIEDSNKALSLVENPFPTATNASATVLMNKLGGWTTSGMFKLLLSGVADRGAYSTLRVKVYLGTNLYYPYIYAGDYALPTTVNGETYASEAEWRKVVRTNDWNVLVYDLKREISADTNLGAVTELQFRPLSNWDHSNFVYTGDPVTDNRTVYFDDIEFLK